MRNYVGTFGQDRMSKLKQQKLKLFAHHITSKIGFADAELA